jgi:hypothetical protein
MQKATATYVAPIGDSKVCEMGGVTFHDGKPVELNSYEHPHLMKKLPNNDAFDVVVGKEDDKPMPAVKKRGRPSAADKAAAKAASDEADRLAKEATEKAKAAKADLEEINKAPDVTQQPTTQHPVAPPSSPQAQGTPNWTGPT